MRKYGCVISHNNDGRGIIASVTGFLPASGVIGVFAESCILALTPLIVTLFGSSTLTGLVFAVLVLPLPVMGPPGFFPKILIGLLMGFSSDLIRIFIRKRKKVATITAGAITQVTFAVILWIFMQYGIITYLPKLFLTISGLLIAVIICVICGSIGGFLAWGIYNKIKNTNVVKRIQK